MAKNFDPTRTSLLRKKFMADMNRRINRINKDIQTLLVTEDALGLSGAGHIIGNAEKAKWIFQTDAGKVEEFRKWMQTEIDANMLSTTSGSTLWSQEYMESSYRKGIVRGYTDVKKEALAENLDFYNGSKEQFLNDAFNAPEAVSKMQLIFTRSYESLKGFTDQMASATSRVLADGLAHGLGASVIAKNLRAEVSGLGKRRAMTIARTEIINAHAEGQLDSFEKLGVEEVGIQAEWSTAGDDRVCQLCAPREGEVMSVQEARGQIPFHPNCRCAWVPVVSKEAPKVEKKVGKATKSEELKVEPLKEKKPSAPSLFKDGMDWTKKNAEEMYHQVVDSVSVIPVNYNPKTDEGRENLLRSAIQFVQIKAKQGTLPFQPTSKKVMSFFTTGLESGVGKGSLAPQHSSLMQLYSLEKYGNKIPPSLYGSTKDELLKSMGLSLSEGEELVKLLDIASGLQKEWMKLGGLKELKVYRGMGILGIPEDELKRIVQEKTVQNFGGSYWTTEKRVAAFYAQGPQSVIVKTTVPVDDIAFFYGGHTNVLGYESGMVMGTRKPQIAVEIVKSSLEKK